MSSRRFPGNVIPAPLAISALVVLVAVGAYLTFYIKRSNQEITDLERSVINAPRLETNLTTPTTNQTEEPTTPVTNETTNSTTNTTGETPETPTENDETADWQTYTNDEYGFSFKYPKDWKVKVYSGQKEMADLYPSRPASILYLTLQDQNSKSTDAAGLKVINLEIINKETYNQAQEQIKIDPGKPQLSEITIGGTAGQYYHNFSASSYTDKAYWPKDQNYFYIATSTEYSFEKTHQEKVDIMKQILASFKFTD